MDMTRHWKAHDLAELAARRIQARIGLEVACLAAKQQPW